MMPEENTMKRNITTVGELRSTLRHIAPNRPLEVRTLIVGSGLTIDEATLHEDGHVILYIGLNAASN